MSTRPPTPERRTHVTGKLLATLRAEAPHGCITALRLRALATAGTLIVNDRAQCAFNPAGPDRDHEFTDRCPCCRQPRCPHCHCHVQ